MNRISQGVTKRSAGSPQQPQSRSSPPTEADRPSHRDVRPSSAAGGHGINFFGAEPRTQISRRESASGERFVYFWRTRSPFSNFHRAAFTMTIRMRPGEAVHSTHRFFCSEQAFMYCKALFAGDTRAAEAILAEKTSPTRCKAMGRRVRNLDPYDWTRHSKAIMRAANACKFAQNPDKLQALMATGSSILVEAAPNDKLWGIGLDEAHARRVPPERWPGSNRLGRVLTQLRDEFKGPEGAFSEECILRP